MKLNGVAWSVTACLFLDDTVLVEIERELLGVVDQFQSVCSRRKLRVNAGKSKVMVLERREVEVVDFGNPYRVSVPIDERCEVVMGGDGEMEEVKGRVVKGRSVTGSLARVMKGRNVSMEVKRSLRNSILLPTMTYGSETWTWNRAQQSRV